MLFLLAQIVSLMLWWKTVALVMKNRIINVETVGGSSLKRRSGEWLVRKRSCIIDRLLLEKLPRFRHCPRLTDFRTLGATICQSEIQASWTGGNCAPKAEKPSKGSDGWVVVVRGWQREWTVGLASDGCCHTRGCWLLYRRPEWQIGSGTVGLFARRVSLLVPFAKRDFWVSYPVALPSKRHRAVGKETGLTSYIERFNCTLRQRVSRLVRKTLSFSKKLDNHVGAIWNFIHHYNASLPVNSSCPL